jgi:hypothetical protein
LGVLGAQQDVWLGRLGCSEEKRVLGLVVLLGTCVVEIYFLGVEILAFSMELHDSL